MRYTNCIQREDLFQIQPNLICGHFSFHLTCNPIPSCWDKKVNFRENLKPTSSGRDPNRTCHCLSLCLCLYQYPFDCHLRKSEPTSSCRVQAWVCWAEVDHPFPSVASPSMDSKSRYFNQMFEQLSKSDENLENLLHARLIVWSKFFNCRWVMVDNPQGKRPIWPGRGRGQQVQEEEGVGDGSCLGLFSNQHWGGVSFQVVRSPLAPGKSCNRVAPSVCVEPTVSHTANVPHCQCGTNLHKQCGTNLLPDGNRR